MTRAEAIEILDSIARRNVFCTLEEKPLEAFWMATEALREQEQREQGCEYCKVWGSRYCPMCGKRLED